MVTEASQGGQPEMVLSGAIAIPDLDELEDQVNDQGNLVIDAEVDTQGGQGSGVGAAGEATDSGGGGGSGAMLGLAAEAGSDVATGGGQGAGMMGGLLGGISKMTLLLGAAVGFLALLEPVQAALGGLLRIFEILVVPLVMSLTPLIQSLSNVVTDIVRFFRNPGESIAGAIRNVMEGVISKIEDTKTTGFR